MPTSARGATRVLVLTDAPVLRRGLAGVVGESAEAQIAGAPGEPRRAVALADAAQPDAVVVELGPGRAGTLDAVRDLRRRHPAVAVEIGRAHV